MFRFFRLIVSLLIILLAYANPAFAAPSLWYSDHNTVYQADLVKAKALSPDVSGGTWVVTAKELIRQDSGGISQLVKPLDPFALDGDIILATAPWDGSLWLATNKTLLHISIAGDIQRRVTKQRKDEAELESLAVGLDQRVWQLNQKV